MRIGIFNRVEFRTFWQGQTWTQTQSRPGGPWRLGGGLSDMEVGFKWQLRTLDKERKWIPSTALITSIYAPTGGTSVLGSHTFEPYINLIYGWSVTDKLTLGGSTGYLGMRVTDLGPGRPADSFQRYHQSLVAFFSVNKRTTLFYEWYVWMFTNAADNRPTHYMDGGILYLLTPNMQLDLRAGFGLSGHPDDFFTGAGYSVRF
jgi:Putative MetA-pathway of phenol degradation